jgi:hypothetical protein
MLLPPPSKAKGKGRKNVSRSTSTDLAESVDATIDMVDGIEPSREQQVSIDDWELATGRNLDENDVEEVAKLVTWYYVKWDDLQYDQCQLFLALPMAKADSIATWDTPPPVENTKLYDAYKVALRRYLRDRNIVIPILDRKQIERREITAAKFTRPPTTQPKCIVGGVSFLNTYLVLADIPDPYAVSDERFPVAFDQILQA